MRIIYFSAILTTTHYKIAKKELINKRYLCGFNYEFDSAKKKLSEKKKEATKE
jgi:hypothetical protein